MPIYICAFRLSFGVGWEERYVTEGKHGGGRYHQQHQTASLPSFFLITQHSPWRRTHTNQQQQQEVEINICVLLCVCVCVYIEGEDFGGVCVCVRVCSYVMSGLFHMYVVILYVY